MYVKIHIGYYPMIHISRRLHPLLVTDLLYYSVIKGYYPYPEYLQTEENHISKILYICNCKVASYTNSCNV